MTIDANQLVGDLKKVPWWAYAVAGGVGLAGFEYVKRSGVKGATVAATAQSEQQPPDGLSSADLAGLPFDYYDWSPSMTGDPSSSQTPGSSGGTVTTGNPDDGFIRPNPVITDPNTGRTEGDAGPPPNQRPPSSGGSQSSGPTPSTPTVYTHAVEAWPAPDSTLSGIAAHYGWSWSQLYNYGNDRQIIDNTAHQHGHNSQEYNWLYPGELLQVPAPW